MLGIKEHLEKSIIPFWKKLIDHKHGGFFGSMNNDLVVDEFSDKSIIAHARYLYAFSLWYNMFQDESLIPYMNHSYQFIQTKFKDQLYGGYYWMLDYLGNPKDTTKHVYGQSFVIYALAEYGEASRRQDVIDEAFHLFWLIDKHAYHNPCHYDEQFKCDWTPIKNGLLAAHGIHLPYTTNSILHILEAYTNLYRIRPDLMLKERMIGLLKGFKTHLYNRNNQSFYMYLDEKRTVSCIGESYGHDIETCWLIDLALQVLDIKDQEIEKMTCDVAQRVYEEAMTSHGLISERINGNLSLERIWWVQAEAMVGFMNHYQKSSDKKFLDASIDLYQFIQKFIVDQREGSEWFWGIDESNNPLKNHGIAEAWKAPYHNGRALVELLKRGLK